TCTYTDTKRGKIVVKKITDPAGDPATFAFTGDLSGSVGDGGVMSKEVKPGSYLTTEAVPAGWDLTSIKCDDSDSSGTGATARYAVAAGETVICTYTDTKRGRIVVKKVTEPAGDPATFAFTGDLSG